MSSAELLDELFAAPLHAGRREAKLIELYTRRSLELERAPVYAYFHQRRQDFLRSLGKPVRGARFVMRCWQIAPAEHWPDWASAMPEKFKGGGLASEAGTVVVHLLSTAGQLETAAIDSVSDHLPPLKPALAALPEAELSAIGEAASATLAQREWWLDQESIDRQLALHGLIRSVEESLPRAGGATEPTALRDVRYADLDRPQLDSPLTVRGMVLLAQGLARSEYVKQWNKLPKAVAAEQPMLFAETVAARVVLEGRESGPEATRKFVTRYLKEIKALAALGEDYHPQLRWASVAFIDLQPRPFELSPIRGYLGPQPGEEALEALVRWAKLAKRRDLADALIRLIEPSFDPTAWADALSQGEYTEAPVIRALSAALLQKGTTVDQRCQMAALIRSLRLRTQGGRDQVADLIGALLKTKNKEDLRVALVLCEGLGPEHQRATKLQRAFVAYAKNRSHSYTPTELTSIAATGIRIPDKHLSKGAVKRSEDLIADGLRQVGRLGKFIGLGPADG